MKSIYFAALASLLSSSAFGAITITLSSVTPEYRGSQAATVTATLQSQPITFASTVKLHAAAPAITDTKSFSSATSQADAETYLKTTYCGAAEVQNADITVMNEQASSVTTLHPTATTDVTANATRVGNAGRRSRPIVLHVQCPTTN